MFRGNFKHSSSSPRGRGSHGTHVHGLRRPPDRIVRDIPNFAVGKIIGAGGKNIKRLQNEAGVDRIVYDKEQRSVQMWGGKVALDIISADIERTISLAINSDGYIPEDGFFIVDVPHFLSAITLVPFGSSLEKSPAQAQCNPLLSTSFLMSTDVEGLVEVFDCIFSCQSSSSLVRKASAIGFDVSKTELMNRLFHAFVSTKAATRMCRGSYSSDISVRFGKQYILGVEEFGSDGKYFSAEIFARQQSLKSTSFLGQLKDDVVHTFESFCKSREGFELMQLHLCRTSRMRMFWLTSYQQTRSTGS
jgi:hypothetical protein